MNADFGLKGFMAAIVAVPIFIRQAVVQKAVALTMLVWIVVYIALLFGTLPKV